MAAPNPPHLNEINGLPPKRGQYAGDSGQKFQLQRGQQPNMHDTHAYRLITALSGANTPNPASSYWISDRLGVPWRTISKQMLNRRGVALALAVSGWEYRPGRTRRPSSFIRVSASKVAEVESAVGLPWATICRALLYYPHSGRGV